jgi:hypothetical protein
MVRPCSSPASERSWLGAPKKRCTAVAFGSSLPWARVRPSGWKFPRAPPVCERRPTICASCEGFSAGSCESPWVRFVGPLQRRDVNGMSFSFGSRAVDPPSCTKLQPCYRATPRCGPAPGAPINFPLSAICRLMRSNKRCAKQSCVIPEADVEHWRLDEDGSLVDHVVGPIASAFAPCDPKPSSAAPRPRIDGFTEADERAS